MKETELEKRVKAELRRLIAEMDGGLQPANMELLRAINQTIVRQMTATT